LSLGLALATKVLLWLLVSEGKAMVQGRAKAAATRKNFMMNDVRYEGMV
jgi:hypothetical protein